MTKEELCCAFACVLHVKKYLATFGLYNSSVVNLRNVIGQELGAMGCDAEELNRITAELMPEFSGTLPKDLLMKPNEPKARHAYKVILENWDELRRYRKATQFVAAVMEKLK